jgi:hypothetical protein
LNRPLSDDFAPPKAKQPSTDQNQLSNDQAQLQSDQASEESAQDAEAVAESAYESCLTGGGDCTQQQYALVAAEANYSAFQAAVSQDQDNIDNDRMEEQSDCTA